MISGKKILYIITQSKFGGAQKYVLDLAQAFGQENNVTIAVGEPSQPDEQFFKRARELPGVKTTVVPSLQRGINPLDNIRSVWQLKRIFQEQQPDLIHINSSMAGFTASLAAKLYNFNRRQKIKVVYTAHGFVFDEPLPVLARWLYKKVEQLGAHWKDAIITVSDQAKVSGVKNRIAGDKKFSTIHNGINLQTSDFLSKVQARKELGLPEENKIIGSIASHYPTKGLPYLIEAAAQISDPSIYFAVIGDGPETSSLQQLINQLALTERFHLLGSREQAWRYLKAFDIFVLPSVKEGHPYAILEAGSANIPVIASAVGGIPEVIIDGNNGILVPPAQPQALAETIQQLLASSTKGRKLAINLKRTIEQDFSFEQMVDKTSKLYQQLLA